MTKEEMKELNGLAASMGLYDDKHPCKRAVILGKAIKALEQKSKAEKVIKMRDATSEEQKSVDDYIKSISKPTGVNFGALQQEPILDKIKGYIDHIRNTGVGKKKSLEFIEKFIEGLKAESEEV